MDYRTSSTPALPKKFGTATATSIYDGVFSGAAPFRPSSFSSRVEDFGEIFGGSGESRRASSIPVLDVPALHERKVSVDVRSSRLEYSNIFGGSGGPEGGALSFEDLIGEPKKVRSLTREERNRAGARSPSEVSVSGSEDNQVLQRPSDHTSDKAKRFNLSYNRSHGGSKDGTDGMTHITQLHDVPGFARVIDESNPLKQATGGKSGANDACSENGIEKSKSSISHSTPEKQNKDVCRDGSHSNGFDAYESGPRTGSFVMGTPSPSRFFSKFDSKGDSRYEASPSNASEDGAGSSSPPYFDEEVDANSAAAESAAAVRKAIEQAQARINVAKELMEKRKDLFQGKALFKGMGTEKRKEGKKVKRANKFSEMEPPGVPEGADIPKQMFKENEKPNCLVMPDIVEQKKHLNGKNILGGTLEFRCTETQAQACTKLGDLVEGDEANETKSLEEKRETSVEKIIPRVDDYEMQRTITTELSEIPVGIVIPQEIHDRSKVCTVTVAPECGMHRIDSGSAEQLHNVEDDKMGLEVGHEQLESAVTFRVNNEQGECQENIQELHEIEFEKQLETQHVDCVWEENGKKPGEGCGQKQENISSGRDEIREEDENRDRLGEFCEDGKDSVRIGNFEENETECDSFYSEAENDLLDHCQETLHETSDGFLDGGETIGLQDEDQVESNYQHDTHEQAENANIPIEVDLQIDIGNHEIQVVSRCQENLIDGAEECSRSADGNLIGTVEASGYDSVEGYFNVSGSKVEPKENERMTDTANLSVEQNEKLVTDNTDSEEKEESNFSVEKKDSAVVDNYNSEETCGLEAFHLSWCSLDVNEIKKQQEVTEITGLNENTVKSRFTGINMGHCQSDQNAEEPKPTVFDLGNHEGGLVSEMHFCDHREKDETSSSQKEDEASSSQKEEEGDEASSSQKEEEEDEASSSQKEEVHYYINQDEIEAEFSDDYDSLLDSEVIVEAECQPDSSERKDEIAGETTEEKSSHIINQEEENWPTEMAKEQKTGNSMTIEGEPVRDSFEKTDEEKERDKEREKEREREREREKERMAVERAIREARERAFAEARERAERAAVEKATAEARQRVMAQAREKLEKASAETVDGPAEKKSIEARLRAQRAAVERATAEARERALEKALSEKLSGTVKDNKVRQKPSHEQQQKSSSSSTNFRNSSSSSHGGPSSGERYEGANGESAQRSKARLERHQRTAERAAKALAEKNMRDLLAQREQAERNRLAEALDSDIKRWSSGKHGNLRALLSTLQYILGPDSGWQPVSLTEIVTTAAVKKAYRRATLCVHPDKLQQRGASLQQKYICEKVFDLLKEAWNRFTAEEK